MFKFTKALIPPFLGKVQKPVSRLSFNLLTSASIVRRPLPSEMAWFDSIEYARGDSHDAALLGKLSS